VLRDEMASDWMNRTSKYSRNTPVVERSHAEVREDNVIKGKLNDPIGRQILGWWELLDTHRPEGIEANLHHHPDSFSNFTRK